MNRVRVLLTEAKFAELEAIEKRTRDLSVTLSDGQPQRAAYFAGVQCACGSHSRDERRARLPELKTTVEQWRKAYPDSIAAKIAEAGYYTESGWLVRGEGYANTVPPEAWPVFRKNLTIAAQLLDAIGERARDEPAWYEARLKLMRALSAPDEEYEMLLDEAMSRFPLGETMYSRLQWSSETQTSLLDGQTNWPRMKKGFERIVADYPDQWNLIAFARFACKANDVATLSQLWPRVEGIRDGAAWGGSYTYCKLRVESTK